MSHRISWFWSAVSPLFHRWLPVTGMRSQLVGVDPKTLGGETRIQYLPHGPKEHMKQVSSHMLLFEMSVSPHLVLVSCEPSPPQGAPSQRHAFTACWGWSIVCMR